MRAEAGRIDGRVYQLELAMVVLHAPQVRVCIAI